MHQSLKCNMSQINCTELTQFDWIIDLHRKLCNSLNPDHLDTICDILNNEEDKEEKWKWKDYFQKWWWGNHATYRASWHNLFLLGPVYLVFPKVLNDVNWSIIVPKKWKWNDYFQKCCWWWWKVFFCSPLMEPLAPDSALGLKPLKWKPGKANCGRRPSQLLGSLTKNTKIQPTTKWM